MKNQALMSALGVSQEDLEPANIIKAESAELLEVLQGEEPTVSPQDYVADRLEAESDVGILEEQAAAIEEAGETVSSEQLNLALAVANAVTGRYGRVYEGVAMESSLAPSVRAPEVIQHLRDCSVGLESALNISLESYSLRDMWDSIGMLNRNVPELGKKLDILKNYKGTAKISMMGMAQAFRVNGEMSHDLSGTAGKTAELVQALLDLGTQAIENSKKAADIAAKANWADEGEAAKATKAIDALPTIVNSLYDKVDNQWTMGNRKLSVKRFDIRKAEVFNKWGKGGSLNVSWQKPKTSELLMSMVPVVGGYGVAIMQIVEGSSKREVKIDDFVKALDKIKQVAGRSAAIRTAAPKKWAEHKALVKRLKDNVKGSADAKAAIRVVAEQDRLGWEALNGAFTILQSIIQVINDAAEKVFKEARK